MLIAPSTPKDIIRRFFTQNLSFKGVIYPIISFIGSIASIIGISFLGLFEKMEKAEITAILFLAFFALFFQYKYYQHKDKVSLANSLHIFRHKISEEVRLLDDFFFKTIISQDPTTIDKNQLKKDIEKYYSNICEIISSAFASYGITTSGVYIKSLNQKNSELNIIAKKSTRCSPEQEELEKNIFARLLIHCLSKNTQLITDFKKTFNHPLPKVPINRIPQIACLALCDFENEKFPSSLNEILNENGEKSNNRQKSSKQMSCLKERVNGNYKSCLGLTISDRKQIQDPVSIVPVAGFLGIDSQEPHDFEKIDKPFLNFLAGITDSLYVTLNKINAVYYA